MSLQLSQSFHQAMGLNIFQVDCCFCQRRNQPSLVFLQLKKHGFCVYTVQLYIPSIFSYVSQYVLLQTHTNELCPKSLGTQGSAKATDANEAIKMKTSGVHKSMLSLMFYCVICVTVVMLSQSWVCSIMIWCSDRQTRISFCQHVTWDMWQIKILFTLNN